MQESAQRHVFRQIENTAVHKKRINSSY